MIRLLRTALLAAVLGALLLGRPAGAAASQNIGFTVALRFLAVDNAAQSTGFQVVQYDPVWVSKAGSEGSTQGHHLDGGDPIALNYKFTISRTADGLKLTGTIHTPGHTPAPSPVEGILQLGKPGVILRRTFGDTSIMMQATVWFDFALPDLDGRTVRLSQFRGELVLLDFWATWCVPCKETLPHTQKLAAAGYKVLTVNAGESREKASRFLQDNGYAFPVALDAQLEVANLLGVTAIPTFVLIGPDGGVVKQWTGAGHEQEIEDALKAAKGGS